MIDVRRRKKKVCNSGSGGEETAQKSAGYNEIMSIYIYIRSYSEEKRTRFKND